MGSEQKQSKQDKEQNHYFMSEETRINLSYIKKDIKEIKENHLYHIEKKVNNLKTDFVVVSQDVKWLKKFFWIVATASVGSLITGVLSLLFK